MAWSILQTREENIRDWLLENCVDENGVLDISGINLSDAGFRGDVNISGWIVEGNLDQSHQRVIGGSLIQSDHSVGGSLEQGNQLVLGGDLIQSKCHVDNGNLIQSNQRVGINIEQNNQSAGGNINQSYNFADGCIRTNNIHAGESIDARFQRGKWVDHE